jgi:hypothetical protein
MIKHGYYLAHFDSTHGDATLIDGTRLADEARKLWDESPAGGFTNPGRYDGASVFTRPDGALVYRLTVQNFFEPENLRVHVVDRQWTVAP